jgi:hypothetical protein
MKINKISLALASMGVVSLASVAQANTVLYLTGSTAARAFIFSASTTVANGIFTGGGAVVAPVGGTSGLSQIVYEGTLPGIAGVSDISCSFSGSEAGIGSVANAPLSQTLFNAYDPNAAVAGTSYPLPNSTPAFYQPNGTGGWNAPAALPGGQFPDLTMADTSQAVSRTPNTGATLLTDYGIVAVVPFTWLKGYDSAPDQAYNDLNNVTTPELYQAFANGDALNANLFTGVPADSSDGIAIFGRNFGSGTRINTLLNAAQSSIAANVSYQQFAYGTGAALYPAATPGTLTVDAALNLNGQGALYGVGNDGFDSGGNVATEMETDGANNDVVPIGYLGISDAKSALTFVKGTTLGGVPTALPLNGVFEGDLAVENGDYTFWGSEHLLGKHGQVAPGTTAGNDIYAGIHSYLTSIGAGTVAGNISTQPAQSILIPTESMQVSRGHADSGFPSQVTLGNF